MKTRVLLFLLSLLCSQGAYAASKPDLSGLGKKNKVVQKHTQPTPSTEHAVSTETFSSQVYRSAGRIETPVPVQMVKSTSRDVPRKKAAKVAVNAPSAFAFIDKALGITPVKPWEKGTLAKKEMKPGGLVPEFDLFSEKVFAYKQGSVGGVGVGGGGCGCN